MPEPTINVSDPVGISDIATRAGVQPVTVRQWRRRHAEFPPPRWTVSAKPTWEWADVVRWLVATDRIDDVEDRLSVHEREGLSSEVRELRAEMGL